MVNIRFFETLTYRVDVWEFFLMRWDKSGHLKFCALYSY